MFNTENLEVKKAEMRAKQNAHMEMVKMVMSILPEEENADGHMMIANMELDNFLSDKIGELIGSNNTIAINKTTEYLRLVKAGAETFFASLNTEEICHEKRN